MSRARACEEQTKWIALEIDKISKKEITSVQVERKKLLDKAIKEEGRLVSEAKNTLDLSLSEGRRLLKEETMKEKEKTSSYTKELLHKVYPLLIK